MQPFDRFWWNLAWWRTLVPYSGSTVKILNFWKFKMAAAAILKITKIAISPRRFDRSLRNLIRWCKMGLLTAPTGKTSNFTNPRWRTAAILRTVKSPYLCSRLTDFDEIWHGDAYWPPTADQPLKLPIFENPRRRRPPSWKITEIAIYPQRFDQSLRNLVHWCKIGLLTAPTVKKIEFHKSEMADGRHFKNRFIILSQQRPRNLALRSNF